MKPYRTVGWSNLQEILDSIPHIFLVDDPDEYVIHCKYHELISTSPNTLELIPDIQGHVDECKPRCETCGNTECQLIKEGQSLCCNDLHTICEPCIRD